MRVNFRLCVVQNGVISNVHNDTDSKMKELSINETHVPCPGFKSVITELSIENGLNEEDQKRLYQLHDHGT